MTQQTKQRIAYALLAGTGITLVVYWNVSGHVPSSIRPIMRFFHFDWNDAVRFVLMMSLAYVIATFKFAGDKLQTLSEWDEVERITRSSLASVILLVSGILAVFGAMLDARWLVSTGITGVALAAILPAYGIAILPQRLHYRRHLSEMVVVIAMVIFSFSILVVAVVIFISSRGTVATVIPWVFGVAVSCIEICLLSSAWWARYATRRITQGGNPFAAE